MLSSLASLVATVARCRHSGSPPLLSFCRLLLLSFSVCSVVVVRSALLLPSHRVGVVVASLLPSFGRRRRRLFLLVGVCRFMYLMPGN